MDISVKRLEIQENPANEVTDYKIFTPRKIRNKDGSFSFNENGIFSERIFGKIGKCKCGKLRTPGICPECGTRVLNKYKMPDFYIKFNNLDIPYLDIQVDFADQEQVLALFNYEAFLYDGEFVKFDLKDDISKYNKKKVLIGKDAILAMGATEDWYKQQVHDKLSIPHTSLRKIVVQGDNYFLGNLNTTFVSILRNKHILDYYSALDGDIFYELTIKYKVLQNINEIYKELFDTLAKSKKSVINRELKGQDITGIVRGVITNNFSLDEDTITIGSYFIPTLYPNLYEKFKSDVDGSVDIKGLNSYLINNGYLVLFNRQPTIGQKSILGMKPVFSEKDDEKFVLQINPIVFEPIAGDVDGDTCSVIALYSKEACKEAEELLLSNNYIEGSNYTIRANIFEDLIYSMEKMYEDGNEAEISSKIRQYTKEEKM